MKTLEISAMSEDPREYCSHITAGKCELLWQFAAQSDTVCTTRICMQAGQPLTTTSTIFLKHPWTKWNYYTQHFQYDTSEETAQWLFYHFWL